MEIGAAKLALDPELCQLLVRKHHESRSFGMTPGARETVVTHYPIGDGVADKGNYDHSYRRVPLWDLWAKNWRPAHYAGVAGTSVLDRPASWPDQAIALATWTSPDGFPWQLSVASTQWHRLTEEDGESKLTEEVQTILSLLLVPKPIAAPRGVLKAFDQWEVKAREAPTVRMRPARVPVQGARWVHESDPFAEGDDSADFAEVSQWWDGTVGYASAVRDSLTLETSRRDSWLHAPWLYALDLELVQPFLAELALPANTGPLHQLIAARTAPRTKAWIKAEVADRPDAKHPEWILAEAYEQLVRSGRQPRAAAAFLDGVSLLGSNTSTSRSAQRPYKRERQFSRRHVDVHLVPLAFEPFEHDSQDVKTAVCRWLTDGRAQRDLFLLFGRAVVHLKWLPVSAGLTGLQPFANPTWVPSVEGVKPGRYAQQLRWRRARAPTSQADSESDP